MDPKAKKNSKKHTPGALFLLAAGAWTLSSRAPGHRFIAFGESLEKLLFSAKEKIAKKDVPEADFAEPEPPVEAQPKAPVAVSKKEELPSTFATNGELELIDAKEQPELYAALLERQKRGEVELITRYRRSYESRLIQSKDPMQEYYSGMKNALLRYKGVKSRVSWANETFHQGRNHIAKIVVKTSCLYVYLAVDPETLKGTKYESAIGDASDKKKFGTLPTVIKMKGERKYKYALELIDRICAEDLSLPVNKKFVETDYRRPYQTDEELVQAGLIKMLVAEEKKADGEA